MTTAEIIFGLIITAVLLIFGYTQYRVYKRYQEVKARIEAGRLAMGLQPTGASRAYGFHTTRDNTTTVNSDMVTNAAILGAHLSDDIRPVGEHNIVHRDDDGKVRFIAGAWETPSSYDSGSSSSSSDSSSSGSSYD